MNQRPKLTIGMATCGEFDALWFTIKALYVFHAEIIEQCEVVVVDNMPNSEDGRLSKEFLKKIPNARWIPFDDKHGTAQPREAVFTNACSSAVLCIDSHVILEPGCIWRLIEFFDSHPSCHDLIVGPMVGDAGQVIATHQELKWRSHSFGVWAIDSRGTDPRADPFEVPQQGMGCFACLSEAWVHFHPDFRGFGGCETYIMDRFRERGYKVLCLPFLRWHHKFQRPRGIPYQNDLADRYRNYRIAWMQLGRDLEELDEAFSDVLPQIRLRAQSASKSIQGCRHDFVESETHVRRHEIPNGPVDFVLEIRVRCHHCGCPFTLNDGPGKFVIQPAADSQR